MKSNDVKLYPPNPACFVQHYELTDATTLRQIFDLYLLVASSAPYFHVFANSNSNPKTDALAFEPGNPIPSDEFAICSDKFDMIKRKDVEETIDEIDSFGRVELISFVEKSPMKRNANAFVSDAKNHEVDVLLTKLLVGTFYTEDPTLINRHDGRGDFGKVIAS